MFREFGNSTSEVPRQKSSSELGKMSFHGNRRYCFGVQDFYGCVRVDQAKVAIIKTLPSPTTVKGIIIFLGHAGFYK